MSITGRSLRGVLLISRKITAASSLWGESSRGEGSDSKKARRLSTSSRNLGKGLICLNQKKKKK